jgi:hypothetical protein
MAESEKPTMPENSELGAGTESRWSAEQGTASLVHPSLLAAVRGFGVMISPSLLLDLLLIPSVVVAAKALLGRPPQPWRARLLQVILGTALPTVYLLRVRPWLLHWGATHAELRTSLPGDELVPQPGLASTRAVTMRRSPRSGPGSHQSGRTGRASIATSGWRTWPVVSCTMPIASTRNDSSEQLGSWCGSIRRLACQ